MIKKNKLYRIAMFLSVGIIPVALLFLSSSSKPEGEDFKPSRAPSLTVSISVPLSVKFCGQTVSLERLDMRERFDREINSFTYFHSSTLMYIKKANRYFPVIEPVLKKNGIPDDFKYLCVIESGLDIRALSPMKAAGLWQFIESTAKSYGLEIRDGIDERYHVEKSTEAACRYLQDAYKRYGDWMNVAASYNAGMERISSELQKQHVETAFDLFLVPETSRYIFRIMAAKEIFNRPAQYGFILHRDDLYPPVPVDRIEIRTNISDLAAFAQEKGLNYMQLKEFNLWLRDTQLTLPKSGTKTYQIAVPKKETLYYRKNSVQVHDKAWVVD